MEDNPLNGLFKSMLAASIPAKTATPQFTPLVLSTQQSKQSEPAKQTTEQLAAPPLPRYLQGDFIQQIWDTEANGANKNDAPARMAAVGDNGKARGMFQMHDSYVQTANQEAERKRRIEAQKWAKVNAPGWMNLKSEDGRKYQEYLNNLPPAPHFTSADRMDYKKQMEIYMIMMPWAINNFKNQFHREPTETEMAQLHNIGGEMSLFNNANNRKYAAKFESFSPKKKSK